MPALLGSNDFEEDTAGTGDDTEKAVTDESKNDDNTKKRQNVTLGATRIPRLQLCFMLASENADISLER
jgi:hypothetical protein